MGLPFLGEPWCADVKSTSDRSRWPATSHASICGLIRREYIQALLGLHVISPIQECRNGTELIFEVFEADAEALKLLVGASQSLSQMQMQAVQPVLAVPWMAPGFKLAKPTGRRG